MADTVTVTADGETTSVSVTSDSGLSAALLGSLSALKTTHRATLVAAVNELKDGLDALSARLDALSAQQETP